METKSDPIYVNFNDFHPNELNFTITENNDKNSKLKFTSKVTYGKDKQKLFIVFPNAENCYINETFKYGEEKIRKNMNGYQISTTDTKHFESFFKLFNTELVKHYKSESNESYAESIKSFIHNDKVYLPIKTYMNLEGTICESGYIKSTSNFDDKKNRTDIPISESTNKRSTALIVMEVSDITIYQNPTTLTHSCYPSFFAKYLVLKGTPLEKKQKPEF